MAKPQQDDQQELSFLKRVKNIFIGRSRNIQDKKLFHSMSLTAFLAWIALGSDGLSSSSYGPSEAFLALGEHVYLAIFVAIASGITILIISASYSQIIEAFPTGGGGYLVATKMISPSVGMIAGCALIVDYILTITISVASGTDAFFSLLPIDWQSIKLQSAAVGVLGLTILNLRGLRESVIPLIPIFIVFVLTHAFVIIYAFATHASELPTIVSETMTDVSRLHAEVGLLGILFLFMRAFSLGAGTYTGIEAVSNGVGDLREPRVATAKKAMVLIAASLAITVVGLVVAYLLYHVQIEEGKTLNAVLFERMSALWGETWSRPFVITALVSEAALLLVAAETGMIGGPRVLSSMALDKWFPARFSALNDRFVTQNGVLFMGGTALIMLLVTGGSVSHLVVLYSINVFVTFVLSQLGMVRHWWMCRKTVSDWKKRISINGAGLTICFAILVSVIFIKFREGAWLTFVVTGSLIVVALLIKRHYRKTAVLLKRLDALVETVQNEVAQKIKSDNIHSISNPPYDPTGKTAIMAVSGFNGLGLHTLLNIPRTFGGTFKNFVFIHIGVVDAGNFKGTAEIENLKEHTGQELEPYVRYMRLRGSHAIGVEAIGNDIVGAIMEAAPKLFQKYPNAVFFGGQIVFPKETFITRWLHNYFVFTLQRKFYNRAWPFVIMPIRV
ncbi:MAG: APC family permease [candidate division Zixibacteria bacterium]|nr:APC family permease [candidate division Zixibacteria bacterium]